MRHTTARRCAYLAGEESGYMLFALLAVMTVVAIFLTVAAPVLKQQA